jgi:predicted naringenin-chalcone synthase
MKAKILSVGTSVPKTSFSQSELAKIFKVQNEKALRFFKHPHIQKRYLLPPLKGGFKTSMAEETPGELREKFISHSLVLIEEALQKALDAAGLKKEQIDFISCVTSTGFLVPGLSALIIEHMRLRPDCQRSDIVGMGCNAGLNGMNAVASWCEANPGKNGILICCELCSCIYSLDEEENTSLVNSLFGDGIAASVVRAGAGDPQNKGPEILRFQSYLIPNSLPFLRFNFLADRNRYNFYVDKKTPETLAAHIDTPVNLLLKAFGLSQGDISYWIFHTGGDAILTGIEKKLNLPESALRHTRSILRDYGNISSGSFLFSYQRLLEEQETCQGYGLMATMGPGLTIELALLKW